MKATFQFAGDPGRQRFEIRFTEIPAKRTRDALKERGFIWDPRKQCWHLARPVSLKFVRNEPVHVDGFEYALELCTTCLGMTAAQADQMRKDAAFAHQQAGELGMMEACGIC